MEEYIRLYNVYMLYYIYMFNSVKQPVEGYHELVIIASTPIPLKRETIPAVRGPLVVHEQLKFSRVSPASFGVSSESLNRNRRTTLARFFYSNASGVDLAGFYQNLSKFRWLGKL